MPKNKIIFIDYLRALAILLVIVSHVFDVFWRFNKTVSREIFLNPLSNSKTYFFFELLHKYQVDVGSIGVAIFFMISGFLIPLSLAHKDKTTFLKRRFLKIYPAYLTATILLIMVLYINNTNTFLKEFSFARFIANIFLIQDWFYQTPYDYGIWALLVFIKFYLLASIIYKKNFQVSKRLIFLFSFLIFIISLLAGNLFGQFHSGFYRGIIFTLANIFPYLIFVMMGTGFYWHDTKNLNFFESAFYFLCLFILFCLSVQTKDQLIGYREVINSYLAAFLLFFIMYFFRSKLKEFRPIRYIARISYSLYLINRIIGFTFLVFLISFGLQKDFANILTLSFILLLGSILYYFVERPTSYQTNNTNK